MRKIYDGRDVSRIEETISVFHDSAYKVISIKKNLLIKYF